MVVFKDSGIWDSGGGTIRPIGRILCCNKVFTIGQHFFRNSLTISYLWPGRLRNKEFQVEPQIHFQKIISAKAYVTANSFNI